MSVPICLAMVACDSAYKDPFTLKHTLIGTFSTMTGPSFPLAHPHITTFVALTDGHGEIPLHLEMQDSEEERPVLFQFDGPVTFDDPRNVIEITFKAGPIAVPLPGEYRLKLFAAGEFIMARKIIALPSTDQEA